VCGYFDARLGLPIFVRGHRHLHHEVQQWLSLAVLVPAELIADGHPAAVRQSELKAVTAVNRESVQEVTAATTPFVD